MKNELVASESRQPYARPQLVKHGKVEALTLTGTHSTSRPHYDDDDD